MKPSALLVAQFARHIRISEGAARRLIRSGDLRAHRFGRQWRIFEPDLEDYLSRTANGHERQVAAGRSTA